MSSGRLWHARSDRCISYVLHFYPWKTKGNSQLSIAKATNFIFWFRFKDKRYSFRTCNLISDTNCWEKVFLVGEHDAQTVYDLHKDVNFRLLGFTFPFGDWLKFLLQIYRAQWLQTTSPIALFYLNRKMKKFNKAKIIPSCNQRFLTRRTCCIHISNIWVLRPDSLHFPA